MMGFSREDRGITASYGDRDRELSMRRATVWILFLTLIFTVLVGWGTFFTNEDLMLALAAGRDAAYGFLAQPDYWSFTTDGRVWINQSWLSHLIFYLSFEGLGDAAFVLLKGILLIICVTIVFIRCRMIGASVGVSLVSVILGTLSAAPFVSLRPDNFGLLYFLVLTTFLAGPVSWGWRRHAGCLATMAIWANSHGSFMLGLALVVVKFLRSAVSLLLAWVAARSGQEQDVSSGAVGAHGGAPVDDESRTGRAHGRAPLHLDQTAMVSSYGATHASPAGDEPRPGGRATGRSPLQWIGQHLADAIFIGRSDRLSRLGRDTALWAGAAALCGVISAFANPYGTINLLMPFHQLQYGTSTRFLVDWLPLLHWNSLLEIGFVRSLDVRPFLIVLALMVALVAGTFVLAGGPRKGVSLLVDLTQKTRADVFMELLIAVILIALAFRTRRVVLFAGFALVPLCAFLVRAFWAAWELRIGQEAAKISPNLSFPPPLSPRGRGDRGRARGAGDREEGPVEGGTEVKGAQEFSRDEGEAVHAGAEGASFHPPVHGGTEGGKEGIFPRTGQWLQQHTRWTALLASICLLIFVGWVFFTKTLLPYLPGNPFLRAGSLGSRFLAFNLNYLKLAQFMRMNHVEGRIFSSLELGPFLLFHVPDVELFACSRAQSMYSNETLKQFLAIQFTDANDLTSLSITLKLLKKHGIDAVVLTNRPQSRSLALALIMSAEWACIYRDTQAIVLIRRDHEGFRTALESGRLDNLWYPDNASRIIAQAYLNQFFKRSASTDRDMIEELKTLAAIKPSPDLYWLLGYAKTDLGGCLDPGTKDYMKAELQRLSETSPFVPMGVYSILQSRLVILATLQINESICRAEAHKGYYTKLRTEQEEALENLERRYWGASEAGLKGMTSDTPAR